jgi:long-chain acyl-CoA synthetase
MRNLRAGKGTKHGLYDKLVFNKTREILGGEMRAMITGSAPISSDVLDFLRICFINEICNGYGMTEGTGASTCAKQYDPRSGH